MALHTLLQVTVVNCFPHIYSTHPTYSPEILSTFSCSLRGGGCDCLARFHNGLAETSDRGFIC